VHRAYIVTIDELGGAPVAVEQGYMQAEIAEASYRAQLAIERKERVIVGLNDFQEEEAELEITQLKVDPAVEEDQRRHLSDLRTRRDNARVSERLSRIEAAARTPGTPMMPLFIEAVEAECTLGEICGVLRSVWGEYQPKVML